MELGLWMRNFLELWYPPVCSGCNDTLLEGEKLLCTRCLATVPLTNFHQTDDSMMRSLFFARLPVHRLASLFYYEKIGSVQHLIHELKYNGQEQISTFLGNWLGSELQSIEDFRNIDVVIPVPIHKKRLKTRGYNQVHGFGRAIANCLEAGFRESVIIKTRNTVKQSKLNQSQRISEDNSPYLLNESLKEGLNILLVDDVTTTGTTLVLCARELQKIPNVKISIATMAIAV